MLNIKNDSNVANIGLRYTMLIPFEASITSITRAAALATVTFGAAHGLNSNEYVKLYGITDKTEDNNGAHKVTWVSDTVVTYVTSDSGSVDYTGVITGTGGLIYDDTAGNGDITVSREMTNAQPFEGYVRLSTPGATRFKSFTIGGTMSNSIDTNVNVRMVLDE